jgi:Ca2+-binding RTX toxin-like protein
MSLQKFGWLGQNGLNLPRPMCSCFQCASRTGNFRAGSSSTSNHRVTFSNGAETVLTGFRWEQPTVSFSFYSSQNNGQYYGSETGVSEVSEAVKQNVRNIIRNTIEPFINLRFVEVADSVSSFGQIRLMYSNGPDYAYAYYPINDGDQRSGDIHLSPRFSSDPIGTFDGAPGNLGFQVLIHEILHSLGLKHPGNYNGNGPGEGPFLPPNLDNNTSSVMTYNSAGSFNSGLMPYDILALQQLYGASSLNSSDTTYTFSTTHSFQDGTRSWGTVTPTKLAIWDSGGTDTFNFSQLSANAVGYRFDLGAGGMLSTRSAFNSAAYQNFGDRSNRIFTTTASGTAIAFNVTIENAIGSTSNDTILGNATNNFLRGNSGNDILVGGGGDDTLHGEAGSDQLSGGVGNDTLLGGAGGDHLQGDAGDDILHGGAGNNQLFGGVGSDRFLLMSGGIASVMDFQDGQDRLQLTNGLQFSGLTITQTGRNTTILNGTNAIAVLMNLSSNQITESDFSLA